MGAFNVLGYKNEAVDKALQAAAIEDGRRQAPQVPHANALVEKVPPAPAVVVGSAWAMREKGKVTIKPRVDEDTLMTLSRKAMEIAIGYDGG